MLCRAFTNPTVMDGKTQTRNKNAKFRKKP